MAANPDHSKYPKWKKSLADLRATGKALKQQQHEAVVYPVVVVKNHCQDIWTDNPNLGLDIANGTLDSRVAKRGSIVLSLIDAFPRGEFARTSACVFNLKDAHGVKIYRGSKKGHKAVDLYPLFIDKARMYVTQYYTRMEDGQALVKKLKDGKVNKPEPAVLVMIKKSIEASRRAVLSFVELMTSPLFGGAFVEKDGKLVVVQKASLMSKSKLSFYPSAVTWVMECLASGHELVTLAA